MDEICTDTACPVHFRNDMLNNEPGDFAAITYINELCVYADTEMPGLGEMLSVVLGGGEMNLTYFVAVFEVGHGALSDLPVGTEPLVEIKGLTAEKAKVENNRQIVNALAGNPLNK